MLTAWMSSTLFIGVFANTYLVPKPFGTNAIELHQYLHYSALVLDAFSSNDWACNKEVLGGPPTYPESFIFGGGGFCGMSKPGWVGRSQPGCGLCKGQRMKSTTVSGPSSNRHNAISSSRQT